MRSYDSIDYRLRMRKFVERKMIKESCQRLYYFDHIDQYRYIGFGSLYFVDFKLFHKELGIKEMISIEYEPDEGKQLRFEFNKPYEFIRMNYKKSTDALNEINFDKRSIVWLDYDGNLEKYMFDDLSILLDNIMSGSIFIISLNTSINGKKTSKLVIELNKHLGKLKKIREKLDKLSLSEIAKSEKLLNELIVNMEKNICGRYNRRELRYYCKEFQKSFITYSSNEKHIYNNVKELNEFNAIIMLIIELLKNEDNCREKNLKVDRFMRDYEGFTTRQKYKENELSDKKSHIVIKEMFDVHINKTIKYINNTRDDPDKIIYKQLYYFTYKDGASMVTFGGILYEKKEEEYYNRCCFENLDYIKNGEEEYNICIPKLTDKEMEYFNNSFFYNGEIASENEWKESELKNECKLYKQIYRYLPHFTNADNL
ncbi:hypothetical protein P8V03_15025 [Clostridium sp. A1-XYC3]|uniref:Uncharacterized protein n=1 Tax=Clostridium tanneri TaxID=3037988 RepID=A0ABU4JWC6_9CLOT|nr:O-methyltransferase [Clostridium sp. A1-XYC3]MDW8802460.1 hypothetical protein [Clostridium sp. A1-XYC3]